MVQDLQVSGTFGDKRAIGKRILAFEAAWARLQSDAPGWPTDSTDRAFQSALIRWLQFHEGMLIGEVVSEALKFVRNNPASPDFESFSNVVVDEYQDLNKAEQDLLDRLAMRGNLSIVGDLDQSIYSFRHANPEGIIEFSTRHTTTIDEVLDECRRCPKKVVSIANALIQQNHPVSPIPRLRPLLSNADGDVQILQWRTLDEEIQGIAEYIEILVTQKGYAAADILVLTPRRHMAYGIRDLLEAMNVPTHSFYQEEALESNEAQCAMTLLNLLVNCNDRIALRYWLGHGSPSYLHRQYANLRIHCEEAGLAPFDVLSAIANGVLVLPNTANIVARFKILQQHLSVLSGLTGAHLIDALFPASNPTLALLRELAMDLQSSAPDVEPVTLQQEIREKTTQASEPESGNYVRIMSLHKSKGLTSRAVIVTSCVQSLIPFIDPNLAATARAQALEEQRRLFYVALTRATDLLVLSSFQSMDQGLGHQIGASLRSGRNGQGFTVASQFMGELGSTAPVAQIGTTFIATQRLLPGIG